MRLLPQKLTNQHCPALKPCFTQRKETNSQYSSIFASSKPQHKQRIHPITTERGVTHSIVAARPVMRTIESGNEQATEDISIDIHMFARHKCNYCTHSTTRQGSNYTVALVRGIERCKFVEACVTCLPATGTHCAKGCTMMGSTVVT